MNAKVDLFLGKARKWQEEMTLLREIRLECDLKEDFKWMHPCYTYKDSNVVLIHGFKNYCALLFFKGVLLKDEQGILIQQTENVQDRRQIRFTDLAEIEKLRAAIREYVLEAVKIAESGQKVALKKTADYSVPAEFQKRLQEDKDLTKAFEALTPGRQKGYLLYFSAAKQSATREGRIDRSLQKIFAGKGVDD
ncbi:MAG: YdeI/OmpD-associated family protein [Adhaeribacter sp.]